MFKKTLCLLSVLSIGACGNENTPPADQTQSDSNEGSTGTTPTVAQMPPPGTQSSACVTAPVTTTLTVGVGDYIPALGTSVTGLLADYALRVFDEVKYVPYTAGVPWNPDQVASVACGAATVSMVPKAGTTATVLLRSAATADCPSTVSATTELTLASKDGGIAETMTVDVTAYLSGPKANKPHYIYLRATQPISNLKGSARPLNKNATELLVQEISSETPRVHLGFTIPPSGSKDPALPGGGQVMSGGTEPYAVWEHICSSVCPAVAAPPADFCPIGEKIVQITKTDGCKAFACQ